MSCKCDEDEKYWNNKSRGHPGGEVGVEIVELDPAQDTDLDWQTQIENNEVSIANILRNRRIPRTVLNAQAISTMVDILRWGDSWTVCGVWTCRLEMASVWGRMHVEIIRANMWTAINRTVHTAKDTSKP